MGFLSGLFGGGTKQTTTATQDDHSINVGGGSLLNTGTLTLNTLDGDLAAYAIDANRDVSLGAINANAAVATTGLDLAAYLGQASFEAAQGLAKLSYDENESARNAATLAQQNAYGLAQQVSDLRAGGDPNATSTNNLVKYGALAAVALAWMLTRSRGGARPAKSKRK